MNNRTIFQKELILLAFRRQNYYHRIKYIIFKSSSSKYNEVSHFHISYKGTSCVLKYFPRPAEWQRLKLYKYTGNDQKLWGQKVRAVFLRLKSNTKADGRRRPRDEVPFSCECREVPRKLPGSSNLFRFRKELHRELVVGSASDPMMERLCWSQEEIRSQWNWAPGSS